MLVAPRISECFDLPWSALVCYSLLTSSFAPFGRSGRYVCLHHPAPPFFLFFLLVVYIFCWLLVFSLLSFVCLFGWFVCLVCLFNLVFLFVCFVLFVCMFVFSFLFLCFFRFFVCLFDSKSTGANNTASAPHVNSIPTYLDVLVL